MLRATLFVLLLLLAGLQYRLWWGEGGRLELARLERQAESYRIENEALRARNEELARQVLDLKAGTTVLELRAREELGLTGKDEVFFQFVDSEDLPAPVAEGQAEDAP